MKILVVEDDALFAVAVAATLRDAGYAVLEPVKSAAEAREIFHASQPELVLMNIQLKGDEAGLDLARELTARSGKIAVFISGQREAAAAARNFALGAVVKPHNLLPCRRPSSFLPPSSKESRPGSRHMASKIALSSPTRSTFL